jgi:hypothetical protein
MEQAKTRFKVKKSHIYSGLFLIIAFLLFLFVYNYSFVEVSIPTENENQHELQFISNRDGHVTEEVIGSSSKKFLLRRGSYSISVRDDSNSYFGSAMSPGLLRTNTYSAELQPELAREFVAVEPLSCMNFNAETLFSWICNDTIDSGAMHLAGTRTTPPTINRLTGYGGAVINSSFIYDGSLFVLVRSSAESESAEAIHAVYPLTTAGRVDISNGRVLDDLSRNGSYYASEYQDGFLVFDRLGSTVLYYPSPYDNPIEYTVSRPENQELTLQDVATRDDSYVMTYSQPDVPSFVRGSDYLAPQYISDDRPEATEGGSSEIFISKNNSENIRLSFDFAVSQAKLCGDGLLCINRSGTLAIYSFDNSETVLLYEFSDVSQIEFTRGRIIAVLSDGIVSINPSSGVGHYSYSFGSYVFCGIEIIQGSSEFVACVEDHAGKSYGLLFSSANLAGNPIDKIVAKFSESYLVKAISPYKSFIHVLGEYNDPVQRETGFFLDRDNVGSVNQSIQELAVNTGINNDEYQLIFTVD